MQYLSEKWGSDPKLGFHMSFTTELMSFLPLGPCKAQGKIFENDSFVKITPNLTYELNF